jgi:membrane dipeptidase
MMVDRRRFLQLAGATAAAAPFIARAAPAGYSADTYAHAIVIDALGGPGDFDATAAEDAPLSARAVADALSSGLTAVNLTVGAVGNGTGKFEQTIANIARADRELALHPDAFVKVLRAGDLHAAKEKRQLGLIYGFQDTSMLEGDLGRLAVFDGLGVRIVQPTYNRRNLMGDGCLEAADGGLSLLGHELIAELDRRRLLLDLSHAGARTIAEGIAAARGPLAITHTGCRALADLPRNTSDSSLRALADKGGVAGIYWMSFLRSAGQPHADDLIRHIAHAVDVCGEDHVGLGTDGPISAAPLDEAFRAAHRADIARRVKAGISTPGESPDVVNVIAEYNSPRRFLLLADDLAGRGWPASRIEKLIGGNFARLLTEVWGG